MLILGVILIGFIGVIRPTPLSSIVMKEKFWADKVHANKRYNVIISGDSRVYRGVDPKSVSIELGDLKVLNFGFSSAGFNNYMYKEINKRILQSSDTKIIILGITPYSLTAKAQENSHYKQEKERDPDDIFIRRYVNPVFHFFDPIKPTDLLFNSDTISGYHENFRKDGWVASYRIPSDSLYALSRYRKNFKNNTVQPEIVHQLSAQIKKWVKDGIKVFAMRIPSSQAMEILENEISGYNENTVMKEIESAGGQWLHFENKFDYTSYDGSHLSQESAVIFSKDLGKTLKIKLEVY
jgi:hypothetical protein